MADLKMPNLNLVLLTGRVGKEPELKTTPNGSSVLNFSVAHTTYYNQQERTDWFNITAWGKLAERLAERLHKGDAVQIQGSLRTNEYEGKTYVNIVADRVQILTKGTETHYDTSDSDVQSPSDDRW